MENSSMVTLLAGGSLLLGLIAAALFFYFMLSQRRKRSEKKPPSVTETKQVAPALPPSQRQYQRLAKESLKKRINCTLCL